MTYPELATYRQAQSKALAMARYQEDRRRALQQALERWPLTWEARQGLPVDRG